jgi:flagellar hook-basal body complex protein FliE
MNPVHGNIVNIHTTHPQHFTNDMNTLRGNIRPRDEMNKGFFELLSDSLKDVNGQQNKVSDLTQTMITNPEQVEIHDVMISLEKAKMSLNLTRTIRDSVIKAYREITNLR